MSRTATLATAAPGDSSPASEQAKDDEWSAMAGEDDVLHAVAVRLISMEERCAGLGNYLGDRRRYVLVGRYNGFAQVAAYCGPLAFSGLGCN